MDKATKKFMENQTEKILATMSTYAKRVDEQFKEIGDRFDAVDEWFDVVGASLDNNQQETDVLRDRVRVLETKAGIR